MDFTIVFGDVFSYLGDEYVYFAESPEDDVVFAGRILDVTSTNRLIGMEKDRQARNIQVHATPVYSYVVLSTAEFKKRAVLCAYGIDGAKQRSSPHATLDEDDKARIKEEILSGPAPARLQSLLRLLT